MSDQPSKLYSVRVPADELRAVEGVFRHFPGASPARVVRALLHGATKIQVGNALAKLAADKTRGGKL